MACITIPIKIKNVMICLAKCLNFHINDNMINEKAYNCVSADKYHVIKQH